MIFAGIDPTASEQKATACALMNEQCEVISLEWHHQDCDIVRAVTGSWGVGLDAPCSLPRGLHECCMEDAHTCTCKNYYPIKGRWAEHELIRRGMRPYVISKNTFAKAWIRRGLRLKQKLEEAGLTVLEVFPTGSKYRLFGNRLPRKTTRQGRVALQTWLRMIVRNIPPAEEKVLAHDHLDAILAAHTCYLAYLGKVEAIGDPVEGQLLLPQESHLAIKNMKV